MEIENLNIEILETIELDENNYEINVKIENIDLWAFIRNGYLDFKINAQYINELIYKLRLKGHHLIYPINVDWKMIQEYEQCWLIIEIAPLKYNENIIKKLIGDE